VHVVARGRILIAMQGFAEILATLVRERVEFIVVGGAAAVLQGAPITTQDIDIVHRRTPDNAERLAAALELLDAVARTAARKAHRAKLPRPAPRREVYVAPFSSKNSRKPLRSRKPNCRPP
jgi:hypothetical protein